MNKEPPSKGEILQACPLPKLGVGITYSPAVEPLLLSHPDLFDLVEIEPQTVWVATGNREAPYLVSEEVLTNLSGLPGQKLIHSIGTPVGGTIRPEKVQLEHLRHIMERFRSPWFSDHLSFNQTPDFHTGFFLPPRQTAEGVATAVQSIHDLQSAFSVPVAIETGVNYLRPRPDEMPDGEFVATVVETASCGLLLDLHNLFTNSLNGRQSLDAFLNQIPLDRVWEIHLAGGMEMEGFWLDAHSGAIPEPLFEIAQSVIPALPNLGAIVFEIFPSFVPRIGLDSIREQIERLHELWSLRTTSQNTERGHRILAEGISSNLSGKMSPPVWEQTLGALVTGQTAILPESAQEFTSDPGVGLIRQLIHEFRGSMIVSVLRLTSRLLMLALGTEIFRLILEDYWNKVPPQMFATREAEAFSDYLIALDLQVPQLAKVLEFERAVMATLTDGQMRLITFESDPFPLLRALAEGRLPEIPGQIGRYEIEITPEGSLALISNAPDMPT